MDFHIKRKNQTLYLRSGIVMNVFFAIPTAGTLWYFTENPRITPWMLILLLIFAAGLTYRECWTFSKKTVSYRFSLFALPLYRKSLAPAEIQSISLKTFLRGQNTATEPGSDRKWYQTEQGILKLIKQDETEEILIIDKNKKNLSLREKGEEIADFLQLPFLINENDPA